MWANSAYFENFIKLFFSRFQQFGDMMSSRKYMVKIYNYNLVMVYVYIRITYMNLVLTWSDGVAMLDYASCIPLHINNG